jgi:hypothetical protein
MVDGMINSTIINNKFEVYNHIINDLLNACIGRLARE